MEAVARKKTSLSSTTSTRPRKAPTGCSQTRSSNMFAREEEGAEGATQRALPWKPAYASFRRATNSHRDGEAPSPLWIARARRAQAS